jgi:chorismate mutase / prephenate dehydratase
MELTDLRREIDRIDREMIERLNERVRLATEVGRIKHAEGAEIFVPSREEQVFRKLAAYSAEQGGRLPAEAIRHIWREIISTSIAAEKRLVIAFLGPEATFTEQAALQAFGSQVDYRALPSLPDVFNAVTVRDADYGVIPIENSTGGAVIHSLDLLAETELKIVAQAYLEIEHCLLSRSPLEEIREVRSKDQALLQCRNWLYRHLPKATQVELDSTAHAVQQAAVEPGVAAVASALAADRYGVPIVQRAIQDRHDNVTRFLVIGRECSGPTDGGADRTSLLLSIRDEVGALNRVLGAFANRGINLLKIESRPSHQKNWDYLFFIDLDGHWEHPKVQEAVGMLRPRCPLIKWLGSYPQVPA